MMRLFSRLRLTVALMICPELRVHSGPEAAKAMGLPCDWLQFGSAVIGGPEEGHPNSGMLIAQNGFRPRYRFKTEERQTGEPTQPEEFRSQAAPQGVEHMRSAVVDLSHHYQHRLLEMHGQLRAAPAEHAMQVLAANLLGPEGGDIPSSDRSVSRQDRAGGHQ